MYDYFLIVQLVSQNYLPFSILFVMYYGIAAWILKVRYNMNRLFNLSKV